MEKIIVKKQCPTCGIEFEVERTKLNDGTIRIRKKEKQFCSLSCANSREWSEEDNIKKSESAKSSGKVLLHNQDVIKRKQISDKLKEQYKNGRSKDLSYLKTEEVINKIKYIKSINNKNRLSEFEKMDKIEYRNACKFNFNLADYPNEFNFQLVEEYGWYKAKNNGDNLTGISRDHMYSVAEGYKNKISPELLSHPANCKLMQHTLNKKKNTNCSITIEELYNRIEQWNIKYGTVV